MRATLSKVIQPVCKRKPLVLTIACVCKVYQATSLHRSSSELLDRLNLYFSSFSLDNEIGG